MGYTVQLLPVVYKDLQEAKAWYNAKGEGLGEEFKKEVNKEIAYIGAYPRHYQKKYKELRSSMVTRFPYRIYYLIEEADKRIVIMGVLYGGRDPELIQKRVAK